MPSGLPDHGISLQNDFIMPDTTVHDSVADGQCDVLVDYPIIAANLPRIRLTPIAFKPGHSLAADGPEFVYENGFSIQNLLPNTVNADAALAVVNVFLSDHFVASPPGMVVEGAFPGHGSIPDPVSGEYTDFESRFSVEYHQEFFGLPVHNAAVSGDVAADGKLEYCRLAIYNIETVGQPVPTTAARPAVQTAAGTYLANFPGEPCFVTHIYAYYAASDATINATPTWVVEFNSGQTVIMVDALTGAVVRVLR